MPKEGLLSDIMNCKVVLTGVSETTDRYLLCKTLATELGVSFEEATRMLKEIPCELIPQIPEEAAEIFAEKIRNAGGMVDVLSLSEELGKFCEFHPHRRAKAKCKICKKYICEIDILDTHKKLLCRECYNRNRIRRFTKAIVVLLILVVLGLLWTMIRAPLQRYLRFMASDKHVRVCLVLIADIMDKDRLAVYNEMTAGTISYKGRSFEDIECVFNGEFREITNREQDFMALDLFGLYETDADIPVPWEAGIWRFREFFRLMTLKHKLPKKGYDLYVYVYLVRSEQLPAGDQVQNLGIHRGNKGLIYFAANERDRRDHYLEAIMFCLGRMMGATPKIDGRGYPLYPEGYADPFKPDPNLQTAAELMGGSVPVGEGRIEPVKNILQSEVGYKTAWEFGWISSSFYREAYKTFK